MGLNDRTNVHFLNLPFYETGGVKKGLLTENDISRVVKLLQELKPDQIYAAGDLSDPLSELLQQMPPHQREDAAKILKIYQKKA